MIVTSQEDIDAAIGGSQQSQIAGLLEDSGALPYPSVAGQFNTDEVIGERLLAKTEAAPRRLARLLREEGRHHQQPARLRRQLGDDEELQGLGGIRRLLPVCPLPVRAAAKDLRIHPQGRRHRQAPLKGERSLLDAFQSAAVRNADRGIDALVPLYDFYPSIESFIDTSAKRSIDEAPGNRRAGTLRHQPAQGHVPDSLHPDIVKPNVDNLATLCVNEVDADKLALKRRIQESLARLEQQRLVSRNGDLWFF